MLSDTELVKKYGQFCGYMAWVFVRKSYLQGTSLTKEDAEDIAGDVLVSLLKCPVAHRHEPPYVKRLIINKTITAWRKRLKSADMELHPVAMLDGYPLRFDEDVQISVERTFFKSLQDPHNEALIIEAQIDIAKLLTVLPLLPIVERIVLELHFGLDNRQPLGLDRIARKLGRTKYWADARLRRGLDRVREHLGCNSSMKRCKS